jgi:hypothetical protein
MFSTFIREHPLLSSPLREGDPVTGDALVGVIVMVILLFIEEEMGNI